MDKTDAKNISALMLAYLGDSVFELIVREKLIEKGVVKNSVANIKAKNFVTAKNQSKASEILVDFFDPDEMDVYRRGKNANVKSIPKSASPLEYKKATGVEAVFAFNYLRGEMERNLFLFDKAFSVNEK